MEEVFDFREFVIKILRRFRLLFVLALLFAAILTSYKLYQIWSELTKSPPMQTSADIENNQWAEERKIYLNDQIFYYEQLMRYLQDNLNIIKEINSEQLYSLQRVIMVDTDSNIEYAYRISTIYTALLENIKFYEALADKLETDIPIDYLQELVRVQSGIGQEQDSEHGFLSIYVAGESPEFCITTTDAVWKYINKEIDISNILDEPYSLTIINPNAKPASDRSLLERKLEILEQIKYSDLELRNLKNELKLLDESLVNEASIVITKGFVIKDVLKYTVLGSIVGLGIGLIWIFLVDAMDLRARSSGEVGKKFGLNCLAEFYDEAKQQPFALIDKWIDRLDGISSEKPTVEQSADILASSIEGLTEGSVHKILLTGDLLPERLESLKSKLAEKMTKVDVFCAGDITMSTEALKFARECEEIILVLRKNESSYPNTEKQLKCFDNIGKKVLGFVMV